MSLESEQMVLSGIINCGQYYGKTKKEHRNCDALLR